MRACGGLRGGLVFALAGVLLSLPSAGVAAWRNLSTGDGLPMGVVRWVLEDRDEHFWFATLGGGVSRYDGVTLKTYTTAQGLAGNMVTSILQDRSGAFWFGTRSGVSRYDGAAWTTFDTPDELASNNVASIMQDQAGNLWFGTLGGGASRYDGAAWLTLDTGDGLVSDVVRCVLEDRQGALWFATDRGVSRRDGSGWRTFAAGSGLGGNDVAMMLEDRAGNLWFTCYGVGVTRRDTLGNWRTFTTADGLAFKDVISVFQDRSGVLWFGTTQGISRFDGRLWRNFHLLDGLPIYSITQDTSGNLWFANSGGATRFDGESLESFTEVEGLSSDLVYPVMEDRDGSLWFGTGASGAFRFDGITWQRYAAPDSLPGNLVVMVLRDRVGSLWFPCYGFGVTRRDSLGNWRTFTTADGLVSNRAQWCTEDRDGKVWTALDGGVARFDSPRWTSFTTANTPGLAGNTVRGGIRDHAGNLWFATTNGVSRRDTLGTWTPFRTADGLAGNVVYGMLEDRDRNMWFATFGNGASRRDSLGAWRTFTGADGLANDLVLNFMQDRAGNLWFTHDRGAGVTRFDGSTWRVLGINDGLSNGSVSGLVEDWAGRLWLSTYRGVSAYDPDRVPPRTVMPAVPAPVSAARRQTAVFGAMGESERLEFSYRLDGEAWSDWSASTAWSSGELPDGSHRLEVRARDYWVNVDPTPAVATFEIDATPPAPVIAAPAFGEPVRGVVEVRGTAADARFDRYGVTVRPVGGSAWTPLVDSTTPVTDGLLAAWGTSSLPDGSYEIRLAVEDTLGLTALALVTVRVDNHAPYDDQTAPARVYAAAGGDIYTLNGELHLYFPPHAFAGDAQVTIDPVPADSVPVALPSGATRVLPGFEIGWRGSTLEKPARLEFSLAGVDPGGLSGQLAIQFSSGGTIWRRLGGTVEEGTQRISLAVSEPGRYALFAGGTGPAQERTLSALSFTPRVFSPTGGFADREVGIAFTLGQASAVTVRVYTRAGWLVREVASGQAMNPGANLVRWDGRDRAGAVVADGLYLVTVEALGETRSQTLAVVR